MTDTDDPRPWRCLYVGRHGAYMCLLEDIDYWNSLDPTRAHELRLIDLLDEDKDRNLREAMRKAVDAPA
jgi:hypothetical protein